jgi:hypothetical protein
MKYYYGNSYKSAISSTPVEIESTELLEKYKEVYSNVFPAEDDEEFWVLVYKEKNSNEEITERYDDFDDVRSDFKYLTEETPEDYDYVVLQKVIESQIDGETIEELASWGLE